MSLESSSGIRHTVHHKESVWKSSKIRVRHKPGGMRTEGQTGREKVRTDRNSCSIQYVLFLIDAVFVQLYVEQWILLMNSLLVEMTALQT